MNRTITRLGATAAASLAVFAFATPSAQAAPTGGANQDCGAYCPTAWVSRPATARAEQQQTPASRRPGRSARPTRRTPRGRRPTARTATTATSATATRAWARPTPRTRLRHLHAAGGVPRLARSLNPDHGCVRGAADGQLIRGDRTATGRAHPRHEGAPVARLRPLPRRHPAAVTSPQTRSSMVWAAFEAATVTGNGTVTRRSRPPATARSRTARSPAHARARRTGSPAGCVRRPARCARSGASTSGSSSARS